MGRWVARRTFIFPWAPGDVLATAGAVFENVPMSHEQSSRNPARPEGWQGAWAGRSGRGRAGRRDLVAGAPGRDLWQHGPAVVEAALLPPGEWRPFPTADEAMRWHDRVSTETAAALIAAGEKRLMEAWEQLPATLWLDFARTGNRERFQTANRARMERLVDLTLAATVAGETRFDEAVADGVWLLCEQSSWALPAHLEQQRAGVGLPDVTEPIVDLYAGEVAALLAWIDFLLGARLAAISPVLRQRLRHEVQARFLRPCLDRTDWWWMGWDTQAHTINNWNPWIVSNWLGAALLLESDATLRARHVHKAMRVLDVFLNVYPADGGCDEGPAYWGRAAASAFEALTWLDGASEGRLSLWQEPLLAEMGAYLAKMHLHGEWFVNFADAAARPRPEGALVYRFGRAVGNAELAAFGAWCERGQPTGQPKAQPSLGRQLAGLWIERELAAAPAGPPTRRDAWLPDLQVAVAREAAPGHPGFIFAAKGGHNDESHNHNDVGNFLVLLDGEPLLIDVGVETYRAQTFSSRRYEIWTMQSGWHNLPVINGHEQLPGPAHAARDVAWDNTEARASFALEIASAYPAAAGIEFWRREVILRRDVGEVELVEDYALTAARVPAAWHFVTTREPDLTTPGRVGFPAVGQGRGACLHYDAARCEARVETRPIEDEMLRRIWGDTLRRLRLVERVPSAAARHIFRLTALSPA